MKKLPILQSSPAHWWRFRKPLRLTSVENVRKYGLRIVRGERVEPVIESEWLSYDPIFEDECDRDRAGTEEEAFKWIVSDQETVRKGLIGKEEEFHGIDYYALGSKVALHREFARCAGNTTKLLKFANDYGFLGTEVTLVELKDGKQLWGECMAQWYGESHYTKILLELWNQYASGANDDELAKYVFVSHDVVCFQDQICGGRERQYSALCLEYYFDITPVNLQQESLMRSATRQLLAANLRLLLSTFIDLNVELYSWPQLKIQANTLLGQIFLGVIEDIIGTKGPLTKCVQCEQWFKSEHQGTIYCSDACKMRAYRARKAKGNGK